MLDADGEIKIIDLGLATKFLSEEYERMTDRVGTLYSMAPEVLKGDYDSKCDIWSAGVVTYMILSHGISPFWGPPRQMPWPKRRKILIQRISECKYMRMNGPSWENIAQKAKDFVATLLVLDPKKRPTAKEAMDLSWIRDDDAANDAVAPSNGENDAAKEAFQQILRFKMKARQILAEKLTEREIVELRDALEKKDTDGDGNVGLDDFQEAISQLATTSTSLSEDDVTLLCSIAVTDDAAATLSSTNISYTDFVYEILRGNGRNLMETIARALDDMDTEGTRKVHRNELMPLLQRNGVPESEIVNLVSTDESNDGYVSTVELLQTLDKHLARHHRESMRGGDDDDDDDDDDVAF